MDASASSSLSSATVATTVSSISTTLSTTVSSATPSSTCPPGNSLPDMVNLPIPHNVSVAVIPGSNASDHAMVACCYPNPVHVALGCYEWCEAPHNHSDSQSFDSCLMGSGLDINKSSIFGFQPVGAAPGRAASSLSLAGVAVWALFVTAVSGAVFSS
ncbi:hypothetical protein SEUCBS139899_007055 [Sporothrix eucalyptigena]|uniref:Uncharacterized protein n=1 Tax=Sporothrix eucalyptigena TaxID=1812306 RepID=A0ABP0BK06_9PEZI